MVKVTASSNVWFAITGFLTMGLNFKIIFLMFAMIWRFCVLIKAILLLSLLKMLIIVVLLIALANLKQLIYQENSLLDDRGYIQKCISKKLMLKSSLQLSFGQFSQSKILEAKDVLIDKKNYEDLTIYFTRYSHFKFLKMFSLHYYE